MTTVTDNIGIHVEYARTGRDDAEVIILEFITKTTQNCLAQGTTKIQWQDQ